MFKNFNTWEKRLKISVDIKIWSPWGCLPLAFPSGYIHVRKHKKERKRSAWDLQQMTGVIEAFCHCDNFVHELSAPWPRLIYRSKTWKIIYKTKNRSHHSEIDNRLSKWQRLSDTAENCIVKSRMKVILLKFSTHNQSDKIFILLPRFYLSGLSPIVVRLIYIYKIIKRGKLYKIRDERKWVFLRFNCQEMIRMTRVSVINKFVLEVLSVLALSQRLMYVYTILNISVQNPIRKSFVWD